MKFEYQQKIPMNFIEKGLFNGYGFKNLEGLCNDSYSQFDSLVVRVFNNKSFRDFIFKEND